jgi:hypothetical protein
MRVFSSNPRRHELHLADKYLAVLLEGEKGGGGGEKFFVILMAKQTFDDAPSKHFYVPESEGE